MALSNTEIIKFMIDNSAGVDIDELFKHIWNIKFNEKINVNDEGEINVEEEEIPVEEKEEIPVETPKNKERIMCNECNIPILKIGKNRHYKTKKHLKNTEINNEKQAEETKLMELEDININEIPPPIPDDIQEQKFNYSEEEMNDINEKWNCKLCNKTIHRIQRNQHFKDLRHIYKKELRKKNRNAVEPPYDYKSDAIPEIEGLNYCYCCRLYFQEEKQVHNNSEDHIRMYNFNRCF